MNRTEHLLTCLIEECAEVQQAIAKALRFGLDDHHPDNPMLTNGNEIAIELTDLLGIVELLEDAGIISTVKNTEAIQKKKEKVMEYMDYAVKRRTLIE